MGILGHLCFLGVVPFDEVGKYTNTQCAIAHLPMITSRKHCDQSRCDFGVLLHTLRDLVVLGLGLQSNQTRSVSCGIETPAPVIGRLKPTLRYSLAAVPFRVGCCAPTTPNTSPTGEAHQANKYSLFFCRLVLSGDNTTRSKKEIHQYTVRNCAPSNDHITGIF